MHPAELGVEKNCRSYSCKTKALAPPQTESTDVVATNISLSLVSEQIPIEQQKMLPETLTNPEIIEYPKYEYPTSNQDLDYSLDYTRYTTPLNLNLKKPTFVQQPNVDHLVQFTNNVHTDLSKMHFLYSWEEYWLLRMILPEAHVNVEKYVWGRIV